MLVPSKRMVVGSVLLGGLAASLVGVTVLGAALAVRDVAPPPNPCAIPIDASALSAHDRGMVARRMLACSDVTYGRITAGEYKQQVAALDASWTATKAPEPELVQPVTQWAASVRGVSTQYTATSWSGAQLIGPPDVFPAHGDNVNAWASLGADDRDEWVEVAFAQPMHASAIEVYETYNPGAVRSIEMITASGSRVIAYQGTPVAKGVEANRLRADTACTAEPIVAVRVSLGSTQVPGWNELDAIGLVPCTAP